MARIRSIKPEFWTSQQIVECSPIARLLFVGLWTFADDRGVIPRRPRTIKMQVFPGDDFTMENIDGWLNELESRHLVGRFSENGECYLVVTGWHHQKIDRPTYKYPSPPDVLQFGECSARYRRDIGESSPPEGIGVEGIGEESTTTSSSSHSGGSDKNGQLQTLISKLRAAPFEVIEAERAVTAAVERGCGVEHLEFIAAHWQTFKPAMSRQQLFARISKATPGDDPTRLWPRRKEPH